MRRATVALLASVVLVLCLAGVAQAVCMAQPLDQVIRQEDTVWWTKVIAASAAKPGEPGTWKVTVRIIDVLKGGGSEGGTGFAFFSTCGVDPGPQAAKEDPSPLEWLVGEYWLLVADRTDQGMVAYSDALTPGGLTPEQQYKQALTDLHLSPPSSSPASPAQVGNPLRFARIGLMLPALLVVGIVVLVVWLLARHPGEDQQPRT